MSATAQNYVYRVKITDEKAMQDKPSISREELERIKREVAQYLVRPGERKELNLTLYQLRMRNSAYCGCIISSIVIQ